MKPEETEVTNPAERAASEAAPVSSTGKPAVSAAAPLLMGVKLPIRVLMGRTQMSLRDIVHLGGGSVVELDCSPDDPVTIVVNDRVIAMGEIVVVSGNYGVRITKMGSRELSHQPEPAADLAQLSERLK